MDQLDQTWSNWIILDQTWSIWIKLDQSGSNLINLDQTWSILIKLDQTSPLHSFVRLWHQKSKFCFNHVLLNQLAKIGPVDKTWWQNMLTKHIDKTSPIVIQKQIGSDQIRSQPVDKTCWQKLLTKAVDKTCWQNMFSKHVLKWQTWSWQTFFDMVLLAVWDWLSILFFTK